MTPEFDDLERELAGRLPGPSAELRRRVLAAVRRELAPNDFWRFAALVAAAALLAINLSMSVANRASWYAGRSVVWTAPPALPEPEEPTWDTP